MFLYAADLRPDPLGDAGPFLLAKFCEGRRAELGETMARHEQPTLRYLAVLPFVVEEEEASFMRPSL